MTTIANLSFNEETKEVLVQPEGHKIQDGYTDLGQIAAGTYYEAAREALRDKYGITDMSQITIHYDDEIGYHDPDLSTQFQNNQAQKAEEVQEAREAGQVPETANNGEVLTGNDPVQPQPVVTEVPDNVEDATAQQAEDQQANVVTENTDETQQPQEEVEQPQTEEQTASEQEEVAHQDEEEDK